MSKDKVDVRRLRQHELEERRARRAPRAAALEARVAKGIKMWLDLGRTLVSNDWGIISMPTAPGERWAFSVKSQVHPCACALSATMLTEAGADTKWMSFVVDTMHPVEAAQRIFGLDADEVRDFTWGFDFPTPEVASSMGIPLPEQGIDIEDPFYLLGKKMREIYIAPPTQPR